MTLKQKHVPIRTCVVCRDKSGKRTLTRLVHNDTGLVIDRTGKANGRGAYLCDDSQCWQRAAQSDVLNQALRTSLTPTDRDLLRQHVS
jgi:hypothetical protein